MSQGEAPTTRAEQRELTRGRIVDAAIATMIESGVAATSTLAVQKAAGVSRGALLHHFPTHADLFRAVVERLVALNEQAVTESLDALPASMDPIERAVRALLRALSSPAALVEWELWTAARTDPELRTALRDAERLAKRDLNRVVAAAFGVPDEGAADFAVAVDLTVTFLRGLAVSKVLRESDRSTERLIGQWVTTVRGLLSPAR